MSFLSILQRWTRKSTQRLCGDKLAATRKGVLFCLFYNDERENQHKDFVITNWPLLVNVYYPCQLSATARKFSRKVLTSNLWRFRWQKERIRAMETKRAKSFLQRLVLACVAGRGKGGKSKWATAILPRPIFSRFTRSSLPFPSPSDACVCCHAGYSPRHLGGVFWLGCSFRCFRLCCVFFV